MSDPVFERYREALRQGHLAALRGDQPGAVGAYGEAAALAPDRPLPHAGLGTALRELGRHPEALVAFERALELAPLDETALRGRAGALIALGRPGDAAAALTSLAESLEADGRPVQALEQAREALALAATPARFRLVARLSAAVRIRASAPAAVPGGPGAETAAAGSGAAEAPAIVGELRPLPPDEAAVGISLVADGDALVDAGRLGDARDRYLAAARSHRGGGRVLAALDVCYQALAIAPADADLHLILAELYDERGWTGQAVDKLVLLVRLLDLLDDREARDRLCRLVAMRFASDPRLAAACA